MTKLRAILVGLIALSLAASPVAAAETMAGMSPDNTSAQMTTHGIPHGAAEMSTSMAHGVSHDDCCHTGAPCEKPVKTDCDGSGACMAKCAAISAATVSATELTRPALLPLRAELVADSLQSTPENPPFPPPRL